MIEIKYWDDSDICGFVYSTGYRNIIRLTCEFREREYPYAAETVENGDLEEVPIFQKVVKEYISTPLLVTPQQRAALEKIQLHKYVWVELDNGDGQYVRNFRVISPEAVEFREHVQVILQFQTYYEINRSKQVSLIPDCDESMLANVDYIIASALELPGLLPFYEGMRVLNTDAAAYKDVYAYNSATGLWERQYEVVIEAFLTNNDDGLEYYYDGLNWRFGPDIDSIVNVAGDVYKITGYARRGFVRIEYSEDAGVTWNTLDEFTSGQFKAGVNVTLLATYDAVRAVSYTHSCAETEGLTEANPNAGDFLTVTGIPLTAFATDIGLPSASQNFTVTEGVDAVGNVDISAPDNFEISLDDATWSDAILLMAGYVSDVIYVRATGEASGTYSGNVKLIVDGKTYNVPVVVTVDCDIAWIEDWVEALNGEDSGTLEEDMQRSEDVKTEIADAITDMGGTVNPADTFYSYGNKIRGLGSSGWNPPSDWNWDTAAALIGDTDDGFVGIYACYPDIDNTVAIVCTFAGTATVDWGDGSAPEALTSGVLKEHEFTYSGISQSVTSWGFKPCVVKFESTGDFSILDLGKKHTKDKANAANHWMAVKVRSNYTGATPFQYVIAAQVLPYNIHLLDFGNTLKVRAYGMFQYHKSLQKLIYNFGLNDGIVAATSMFSYSNVYNVDWNNYDWSNWTDLSRAWFNSYTPTPYALEINVNSCSLITGAFRQCYCFSSIKLINSANITNISFALYNNGQVMSFEMDDASNVTTTTSFTYSAVNNLKRLILTGLTVGIDLTSCMMGTTALNAFFTSLGTAAGAQTIVVTGNPGAATCNTAIATGKGFTVTT